MRTVLLVLRADVNARMVVNQGADYQALSLVSTSKTLSYEGGGMSCKIAQTPLCNICASEYMLCFT